jgi:hypothetical protein
MSTDDVAQRWDDPTNGVGAVYVDSTDGLTHLVVRSKDTWRGEPYAGAVLLSPGRAQTFAGMLLQHAGPGGGALFTRQHLAVLHYGANYGEPPPDFVDIMRTLSDADVVRLTKEALSNLAALLPPPAE